MFYITAFYYAVKKRKVEIIELILTNKKLNVNLLNVLIIIYSPNTKSTISISFKIKYSRIQFHIIFFI